MTWRPGVVFPITILISSIYVVADTYNGRFGMDDIAYNPVWYPRILLFTLLALSTFLAVRGLIKAESKQQGIRLSALLSSVALTALFLLSYEHLGFVYSALLLFALLPAALGYRKPIGILATSALYVLIIWYGFHYGLNATPPGTALPTF